MMFSDLLTTLGTLDLTTVALTAAGVGVAVVTATAGLSAWIDNATEGPDGPLTDRDYTTTEQLPPMCSYFDSGCRNVSTTQVAGWELCTRHADEIVGRNVLTRQ